MPLRFAATSAKPAPPPWTSQGYRHILRRVSADSPEFPAAYGGRRCRVFECPRFALRCRCAPWLQRWQAGRPRPADDPLNAKSPASAGLSLGVSDGTRTRDRLDHNQELYQLSYAHHDAATPKSSVASATVAAGTAYRAFCGGEALARAQLRRAGGRDPPLPEKAGRLGSEERGGLGSHRLERHR